MPSQFRLLPAFVALVVVTVAHLIPHGSVLRDAYAAQVTFRWDYTASGAAGFVLYCGPSSRSYPTRVDVGNTETYTLGTLAEGSTSFCAVTAYDPAKVESDFSKEISVYVPYTAPVVNFSASRTSGGAPLSVAFTNTTTGQVTTWAWNFGDGTTSTLKNPTKTYSTPGSYRPVLKATGPGGTVSKTAAAAISVTAKSTAPGLVAAYNFNKGSGTTVADSSGNGNTGTINGATWTSQGRSGRALSFNGVSSLIQMPSSASFNLSSAMTLEAWVFPTASQSGWRTIVQRDPGAYFLYASSSYGSLRPEGGGTFSGKGASLSSHTAIPVNRWTHLALTYDGTTLQLYVNGVQAASQTRTRTVSIQSNAGPLSIGGNRLYGQFFRGIIDEVRVYNRALSPAQIRINMNNPVVP